MPHKLLSGINIFPNPFAAGKEEIRIKYVLKEDSNIKIFIYTLLGDLVRKWKFSPGITSKSKGQYEGYTNEIKWDGRNGDGHIVANGMYLCIISAKSDSGKEREIKYIGVVK